MGLYCYHEPNRRCCLNCCMECWNLQQEARECWNRQVPTDLLYADGHQTGIRLSRLIDPLLMPIYRSEQLNQWGVHITVEYGDPVPLVCNSCPLLDHDYSEWEETGYTFCTRFVKMPTRKGTCRTRDVAVQVCAECGHQRHLHNGVDMHCLAWTGGPHCECLAFVPIAVAA